MKEYDRSCKELKKQVQQERGARKGLPKGSQSIKEVMKTIAKREEQRREWKYEIWEQHVAWSIVQDAQPLRVVESNGWKYERLYTFAHGTAAMKASSFPTRQRITKVIQGIFEEKKEKLKDVLSKVPTIFTTADLWSSRLVYFCVYMADLLHFN